MKNYIPVICLLFALVSCSSKNKGNLNYKVLEIDEAKKAELSTFLELNEIIFLKNKPGFDIQHIDKVIYDEEFILILDKKSRKILICDKKGNPYQLIKHNGKGEGEFINIGDIAFENNVLCISETVQRKLIFYSPEGAFIQEKKTDYIIEDMLNTRTFSLYFEGYSSKTKHNLVSVNNKDTSYYLPYDEFKQGHNYGFNGHAASLHLIHDDQILFSQPLSPDIYLFDQSGMKLVFKINSEKFVSEEILNSNWQDASKLLSIMKKDKLHYGLSATKLLGDDLFFSLNYQGYPRFFYYSSKKDSLFFTKSLLDKKNKINLNILKTNDNNIITYIEPFRLLENRSRIPKESVLYNYLDSLDKNDNPILAVYNFIE